MLACAASIFATAFFFRRGAVVVVVVPEVPGFSFFDPFELFVFAKGNFFILFPCLVDGVVVGGAVVNLDGGGGGVVVCDVFTAGLEDGVSGHAFLIVVCG
eukprot:m.107610 g.107610  ORF g.107610 m.107610 type:complete len:100 (+) comp12693_c0_seq2:770-1069(+)